MSAAGVCEAPGEEGAWGVAGVASAEEETGAGVAAASALCRAGGTASLTGVRIAVKAMFDAVAFFAGAGAAATAGAAGEGTLAGAAFVF